MKTLNNSKIHLLLSMVVLSLMICLGCKKTNNSPSFYFTAEINGIETNLSYNLFATRNSVYGSPDSNLIINASDTTQQHLISIRVNSTPNSLTTGSYVMTGFSGCSYQDSTLEYQGDGTTIIITRLDSTVVQGSLSGNLWRPGPTNNILLPIKASFNIRISN